ncbi:heme ABC transporter permease CcmC [Marinicella sp. S1101]|uniref:heme ABC transporter permease CcmC n=1 Tax=Marinicella marina TaxID=2996016 RepID=UPI00226090A2|nr:heme ABC transporter permease CcmC [Marinicella marina]MCX7554515.1 heme ABC transporter permease CcmC [Marinicella marina]MDJ1140666.1 heme ABC transporter permease CcmC [Marinicella marina]
MNRIVKFYHEMGSPPSFYRITQHWLMPMLLLALGLTAYGLIEGLFFAPKDYQQGDSYRIIFVHVPAAWMSMFIYAIIGICGIITFVWRMKVAEAVMMASVPIGALFTAVTLLTGMLWGKPMWGTYWDWDARMTSQLILLFLYIGVAGMYAAYEEDPRKAARLAALVAIIGLVNLPIIRYSVYWWTSIHQTSSITLTGGSEGIHSWDMLRPLLVMALATKFYYIYSMLTRAHTYLLKTEAKKQWVAQAVSKKSGAKP